MSRPSLKTTVLMTVILVGVVIAGVAFMLYEHERPCLKREFSHMQNCGKSCWVAVYKCVERAEPGEL